MEREFSWAMVAAALFFSALSFVAYSAGEREFMYALVVVSLCCSIVGSLIFLRDF